MSISFMVSISLVYVCMCVGEGMWYMFLSVHVCAGGHVHIKEYVVYVSLCMSVFRWACPCKDQKMVFLTVLHSAPLRQA